MPSTVVVAALVTIPLPELIGWPPSASSPAVSVRHVVDRHVDRGRPRLPHAARDRLRRDVALRSGVQPAHHTRRDPRARRRVGAADVPRASAGRRASRTRGFPQRADDGRGGDVLPHRAAGAAAREGRGAAPVDRGLLHRAPGGVPCAPGADHRRPAADPELRPRRGEPRRGPRHARRRGEGHRRDRGTGRGHVRFAREPAPWGGGRAGPLLRLPGDLPQAQAQEEPRHRRVRVQGSGDPDAGRPADGGRSRWRLAPDGTFRTGRRDDTAPRRVQPGIQQAAASAAGCVAAGRRGRGGGAAVRGDRTDVRLAGPRTTAVPENDQGPDSDASETGPDLQLFPVGTTGFEPATP
ncbi:hypothetical protein SCNRRL3882_1029 [Streptomyces chartreusis NRRL 3882]|uniref:Uncharacterized protein n=1 Tax=Streptomyces chartreusis NRRL 3882 TaxID=1079985 RepID=A0A2N9B2K7_STRCX|nr:hypothetical protein SCNRRL3882_1029 [Streptomyces chartreusis NRRL 3882]